MPLSALLPKEYSFFDFFEEHAGKSFDGARLLRNLLYMPVNADGMSKEIKEIEHDGDRITHHTLEVLHKTFITPLDREEIHALISALDDVLDNIDATAQRLALYDITGITPEAQEMGEIIVCVTDKVLHAVHELRNMKNSAKVLKLCVEIKHLEGEGDDVLRRAMAYLFREHADDPIYVIKWKEIYEFLEECIDAAEDVSNIIEGIVLEHA